MSKILTATEVLNKNSRFNEYEHRIWNETDVTRAMQEFAKAHVKEALKTAADRAIAREDPQDYGTGNIWVDRGSIIHAYSENNIK